MTSGDVIIPLLSAENSNHCFSPELNIKRVVSISTKGLGVFIFSNGQYTRVTTFVPNGLKLYVTVLP